jgi:hypothetical protein
MDFSAYYLSGIPAPRSEWPDGEAVDATDFLLHERETEEDTLIQRFLASNHTRAASSS